MGIVLKRNERWENPLHLHAPTELTVLNELRGAVDIEYHLYSPPGDEAGLCLHLKEPLSAGVEVDENTYDQGLRQAYIEMLGVCLRGLGAGDPLGVAIVGQVAWVKEREETKQKLHELCREFGDDDWPEDLYLPDVIEKHLAKPLWEAQKEKK